MLIFDYWLNDPQPKWEAEYDNSKLVYARIHTS